MVKGLWPKEPIPPDPEAPLPYHLDILNPPTLKAATFHNLDELPPELRLKIWEFFMDHPRLIIFDQDSYMEEVESFEDKRRSNGRAKSKRMRLTTNIRKWFYFVHPNTRPSPLLGVSREVRKTALKFYRIHLPFNRCRSLGHSESMFHLNPECDIVTIRESPDEDYFPLELVATLLKDLETHEDVKYRKDKEKVGALHLGLGFAGPLTQFLDCAPDNIEEPAVRRDLTSAVRRLKGMYIIHGCPHQSSREWSEQAFPMIAGGGGDRRGGLVQHRQVMDGAWFVPQQTDFDWPVPDPRVKKLKYGQLHYAPPPEPCGVQAETDWPNFQDEWGLHDLPGGGPKLTLLRFEMAFGEGVYRKDCLSIVKSEFEGWDRYPFAKTMGDYYTDRDHPDVAKYLREEMAQKVFGFWCITPTNRLENTDYCESHTLSYVDEEGDAEPHGNESVKDDHAPPLMMAHLR